VVVRSAGETGQLYGSVVARDVSDIISSEGVKVGRNQIEISAPIKTIGLHKVTLHLHPEVELSLELNIARSQEEGERQANGENMTSDDNGVAANVLQAEGIDSEDDFDADNR
jgi:large subunit ribosomal protein L9